MGYARYVGRVGALAVALGIGSAVVSGPGVAWADGERSDTSSVDSASAQDRDAEPETVSGPTTAGQTPAGTETSAKDESSPEPVEPDEPEEPEGLGEDAVESETWRPRAKRSAESAAVRSAPDAATDRESSNRPVSEPAAEPTRTTDPVPAVAPSLDVDTAGAPEKSAALTPPAASAVDTVVEAPVAEPGPAEKPARAETGTSVLSSVLSAFGASGSDVPVDSPLVWGLLAFARRQIGQRESQSAGSRVAVGDVTAAVENTSPDAWLVVGGPDLLTGRVSGRVFGSDADRDPLTYAVTGLPAKGEVRLTGNRFVYTPSEVGRHAAAKSDAADLDRLDSFVITVSDGNGGVIEVPVTVKVRPINARPVARGSVGLPDMGSGVVTGRIDAVDRDDDDFTYEVSATTKGTVVVNDDGTFTYTPSEEAREAAGNRRAWPSVRRESFTVTVDDGHGGVDRVRLTVQIAATDNEAPELEDLRIGDAGVLSGRVTGRVIAGDGDGDRMTYAGSLRTDKGRVLVTSTGRFIYTPTAAARHAAAADDASPDDTIDSFSVTVTDGFGGSLVVPVTVTIAPRNAVPMILRARASAPDADSGVVTIRLTAWDRDRDDLQFGGPAATDKGTLVYNDDGTVTYTPTAAARAAAAAAGAPDSERIVLSVSDGHGGSDTATVTVSIAPLAGNAGPGSGAVVDVETDDNGVVTGRVTATDPDGEPLSYSGSGATGKGSVVVDDDGTFTYTPNALARHGAAAVGALPEVKKDTFNVTVSDGKGGTLVVAVTVDILPQNTAPEANYTAGLPNSVTGVVTGVVVATDADGDTRTYNAPATSTRGGAVTVDAATGEFTYAPTLEAREQAAQTPVAETDTFTVTVSDGHGGTAQVLVSVVIAPSQTDLPPVIGEPSQPGTPHAGTGASSGSFVVTDRSGAGFTVDVLDGQGPAHGQVVFDVDPATGVVTYTYTPTWAARLRAGLQQLEADRFTAVVTDAAGRTATVEISQITVAAVHLEKQSPVLSGGVPAGMVIVGDRLYIANAATNSVSVVDLRATAPSPAVIDVGPGPTFLAVQGTRLYVTSQTAGTVSVVDIDPQSASYHTVLGSPVAVDGNPTGIAANGGHLYVLSLRTGIVTVFDITDDTPVQVSTIELGGLPFDAVVAGDRLYVTNVANGTVSIIDAKPGSPTVHTVLGQPIQIGAAPYGIKASPDGKFVYVAATPLDGSDTSIIAVIDTHTATLVDTNTATPGADPVRLTGRVLDVAVSGDGSVLYAADTRYGTVSVISLSTYGVLDALRYSETPAAGPGPLSRLVVSPSGDAIFIADMVAGTVAKVAVVAGSVVAPNAVAVVSDDIDSATGAVKVTVRGSGLVSLDVAGLPGQGTLSVVAHGDGTYTLTYTPSEQARYAAFESPGIDTDTFALTVTNGQRVQQLLVTVPIDPEEDVNEAPVPEGAGYGQASPDEFSGVVTGWALVSDPDGDNLTFSLRSPLDPAIGTVEISSDTGAWTFTPTVAARLAAWNTPDKQSAVFTIVVSDGELKTDIAVEVPITPDRTIAAIEIDYLGGWAISRAGDRLYVINRTDASIVVIDTSSKSIVHTIELDLPATHLAVSADGTALYLLQPRSGPREPAPGVGLFFTAVNTETWQVEADAIQLSGVSSADGFILSPDGRQIYIARSWGYVTPVIDARTYTVSTLEFDRVGSPRPGLSASNVVFGPDGRLYVADDQGGGRLYVYDTASNRLVGDPIEVGGYSPGGLVIDPKGDFVYGTMFGENGTVVFVVDTGLNAKVYEMSLPGTVLQRLTISPDGGTLYVVGRPDFNVNDGATELTTIDLNSWTVVDRQSIDMGRLDEPRLSPDGGRLYFLHRGPNRNYRDHVLVYDTESQSFIGEPILVSWRGYYEDELDRNDASHLILSADGTRLYVMNGFHGVTVIDTGMPPVTVVDPVTRPYAPVSTSGLIDRLHDHTSNRADRGNYAIEKILSDDNETRLIVYAGGTVPAEVFENQGAIANVPAWGGFVDSDLTTLLDEVLADLPAGTEIMAVGFSQGGMEVQNLAARYNYNITTVVSFAAPISQVPHEDEYKTVHIQANGDIVPAIPGLGNDPFNPDQKIFAGDAPTGKVLLDFHGDPETYKIVGALFDQEHDEKFTDVKQNMAKFRGVVTGVYL